jgi:hypothetical protein
MWTSVAESGTVSSVSGGLLTYAAGVMGLTTDSVQAAVSSLVDPHYFTNTIGTLSYTNTGFILKPGSNMSHRILGPTNYLDVAESVTRYSACADVNNEILVSATGPGITAAVVGSSITVTIPAGVTLLSARVRWPGTTSTGFTINLGTTDMPNASFATRWGACFWACREDTGAFLPTATCKLDASNHDQLIVAGLNDVSVNHCMFSF